MYNPKSLLTVGSPITEYAPRTAHALSSHFRVTDVIGPGAVVLKPTAEAPPADMIVVDLYDDFDRQRTQCRVGDPATSRLADRPCASVERTSWMMYRVIAATARARGVWNCFTMAHHVTAGEAIATTPMLNPITWVQRRGDPDFRPGSSGAAFAVTVTVSAPLMPPQTVYADERPAGKPGEPIRISLDRYAGLEVEMRFCAGVPATAPSGPALALAGWVEPRIVRPVEAGGAPTSPYEHDPR